MAIMATPGTGTGLPAVIVRSADPEKLPKLRSSSKSGVSRVMRTS